jgi:starch-binding outer membrane protein, SusD/RagB family
MNKNIVLYLIAFFTLSVTSCSDQFLKDTENYGSYSTDLFSNETETGWFIDKMYYNYFGGYNSPIKDVSGLYTSDHTSMTEEMGGTINNLINPTMTLINAADCSSYYGTSLSTTVTNNPYSRIRDCNYLLLQIDALGTNLSETFRKTSKGQAYFLRALQYYDLIRTYGGVPIVTTVQTASSTDTSIKTPRGTTTECVKQILVDLDSAATLLPTSWTASTNYGRFTKGAALAEKSRVLLTYASPLFNTDWDNSSNQRWKDALAAGLAAETELTADGYGLYGSSAKDWAAMFSQSNTVNKEAIMIQLCSSSITNAINNGWENSVRLSSQKGGGGVSAPKEMIDLFPMANGSRPTVANSYVDSLFFLNRDPRFYRTFAFNGCVWGHKARTGATVWSYRLKYMTKAGATPIIVYPDNNQLKSPAFVRKMSSASADSTSFAYSGTQLYEYRYAELLLNIAECYAATGDIANCVAYLSKIRARVGISAANNYGIGTLADKYAAIEACLYERRVELAYEGKRFWDIQRWMLYNDDSSNSNTTCAKLGISPINGSARTGNYWQEKTISISAKAPTDPLLSTRSTISIDPDAANFSTQLTALANFYKTYLVRVPCEVPLDNITSGSTVVASTILWRQNYYIQGLTGTILTNNSWLKQTKLWNDAYGTLGTFDYQE